MRKKLIFVVATVVLASVLIVACVELVAMVALSFQSGRFISARERFLGEAGNYLSDVTGRSSCQYVDALFPHPYLAFVHHGNPPCGVRGVNNIGLFGPDFPSEKRRDRFVVLLTGGSVAAQFGQLLPDGPRYLEVALNKNYASPTGKPFLVLNGGAGAWKQPQQVILFLLYSDVVDAVITLDGFNERYLLDGRIRFEYPANNFLIVNPFAGGGYDVVMARWLLGRLIGYASQNAVLSHSHAAFALLRGARWLVERPMSRGDRRQTTIQSLFELPADWDRQKRVDWAISQYKKYIRALNAIARERRVLAASFIQPVPAIGKRLTPEEWDVVGDLGYARSYQHMTDALLVLGSESIKVFSLLDIFRAVDTTLYSDHAHLVRDARGESPGYRLMADEIARRLSEAWNLKGKRSAVSAVGH